MRGLKAICAAAMAALAVGGGLFVGTANAGETIEIQAAARCESSPWEVYPIVGDLTLRARPSRSSAVVRMLERGVHYWCWPVVLGDRYTLCGVSNANGWIPIDYNRDGAIDGYSASTCLRDV